MKKIKIKCQSADTLPLDSLVIFQGNLKKISSKNLEKLKSRILAEGFIAPIFVWNYKGNYYILDGTQRIKALLSLREQGYDIPLLPVTYIEAENEKDARQKLLSISSQYGEFEKTELDLWLDEMDDEVKKDLRLLDKEIEINLNFEPEETDKENDPKESLHISKQISKKGDIWIIGKNIKLICDDSTGINHNYDLLLFDPMFDDENIYNNIPEYKENRKMIVFSDFMRIGAAVSEAINKKWLFNYEFILDGCTSWYIPGRPLERHKTALLFGNKEWLFDSAIYDDNIIREDKIVKNGRGKYEYKALPKGKHLSSLEKHPTAGTPKDYKYEKPINWIKSIIDGCDSVKKIYDPFARSFTGAIIAIKNEIEYVGYEINPEVFDLGLSKIYQETGMDAVRDSDGKSFTDILFG